jgi:hypothetical protein
MPRRRFCRFHVAGLCIVFTATALSTLSAQTLAKPPKSAEGRVTTTPRPRQPAATLDARVRRVLDHYYQRPLNTRDDSPWSVLHWSIAYGVDARIDLGGPGGQPVTSIGWLCCNRPAGGKTLMQCEDDALQLPVAPGLQGHHGQFLSMLAQSRVPLDYPLHVDGQVMNVGDLVAHEQQTCRSGMELTFKLIGLAHYAGPAATWTNARGEPWSVERLLQEELAQSIDRWQACCGGAHRLMALATAVRCRAEAGLPLDGPWREAQQRVQTFQRRTFALQNRDGSFSTAWWEQNESRGDRERRLLTSGHALEWLAWSLDEEALGEPPFQRGLHYVVSLLERESAADWNPGPLGHALHALAIYEQRVLDAQPGDRPARLARR